MGRKGKLEDREIKKTVSRENLLKISKRKLKRVKHLIHRTVLIQNTITHLKHTEVEHEVLNHSPVKIKTTCDKYDVRYNTTKIYVRRFRLFSTGTHFLISGL